MSVLRLLANGVFLALLFSGCMSLAGRVGDFNKGPGLPGPQLVPVDAPPRPEPELPPPDPFFHNPPEGVVQRLRPGDVYIFKIVGTAVGGNVSVSLTGNVELPDPYKGGHFTEEFVQGMSPEGFRSLLAERYGRVVRDPSVFLARAKYNPRLAYVVGLKYPQRSVELNDESNLLSVLTEVRWMPGGDGDTVIVFRDGRTRRIWLPHVYRDGNMLENIRILPGDVVVIVPERGIDLVGAARNPGRFFPDADAPLTNFLLSTGGVGPNARLDRVHVFHADGTEESVNLAFARHPQEEIPIVGNGDIVFISERRHIVVYPVGELKKHYQRGERGKRGKLFPSPEGLRLSQYLAINPPEKFGAALGKATIIPPDGSEAIKLDIGALLSGADDQPDPFITPGMVVYIPPTRTVRFLDFLEKVAGIFIAQPIEVERRYRGNRPDVERQPPIGPRPVDLRKKAVRK